MSDPSLVEAFVTRRKAFIGLLVLKQFFYPFIINLEQNWAMCVVIFAKDRSRIQSSDEYL